MIRATVVEYNFQKRLHELLFEEDESKNLYAGLHKYFFEYDDSLLPVWDDRIYTFQEMLDQLENTKLINDEIKEGLASNVSKIVNEWDVNNSAYELLRESTFVVGALDEQSFPTFLEKISRWVPENDFEVLEVLEKTFQVCVTRIQDSKFLYNVAHDEPLTSNQAMAQLQKARGILNSDNYWFYERLLVGILLLSKRVSQNPDFLDFNTLSAELCPAGQTRVSNLVENLDLSHIIDGSQVIAEATRFSFGSLAVVQEVNPADDVDENASEVSARLVALRNQNQFDS